MIRFFLILIVGITIAGRPLTQSAVQPLPIIDVHLHAYLPADWKGPAAKPGHG